MDLTPLLVDEMADPFALVKAHADRFVEEVQARIARMGRR